MYQIDCKTLQDDYEHCKHKLISHLKISGTLAKDSTLEELIDLLISRQKANDSSTTQPRNF